MQLFLNCLLNLQSNSILNEIDTERLFCNIPEIYTANRIFWHENINAVVKASRESGNPLDPDMLLNGFIKVRKDTHHLKLVIPNRIVNHDFMNRLSSTWE